MTYGLSFVYARCRKPISLPAPVAYAHLSAEKAKFKYQALKNREITDEAIVDRKRIEAFLQPKADYPGMSFV